MPRQTVKSGAGGVSRLASLLSDVAGSGRGRQSSLTRWLQSHHDEFAALISERQPGWESVAEALATMGLRDGTQKPPNGERVRKAWWSVRQEAAARRSGQSAKPLAVQAVSDARPALAPADETLPAGVEAVQPSRSRPRLDIQPATRLSGAPAEPVVLIGSAGSSSLPVRAAANAGVVPGAPIDDDQVAEQLRRVFGQMQAGKIPLPKVVS